MTMWQWHTTIILREGGCKNTITYDKWYIWSQKILSDYEHGTYCKGRQIVHGTHSIQGRKFMNQILLTLIQHYRFCFPFCSILGVLVLRASLYICVPVVMTWRIETDFYNVKVATYQNEIERIIFSI